VRAYRETEYRVLGNVPAVLHVGVHCADLEVIQAAHQAHSSAFITACNPGGQLISDRRNAQRQQLLLEELSGRGLAAIAGIGVHPTGEWRGEHSFLVPGLSRADACALGMKFEQNAIIWAGADAIPELILLR